MSKHESELVYKRMDRTYTEGRYPTTFTQENHVLFGQKGIVEFTFIARPEAFDTDPNHPYRPGGESELGEMWPMGVNVGYHSKVPRFEGQAPSPRCDLMQPCYFDGSGLRAEAWLTAYAETGYDLGWVKQQLGNYYDELFYGEDWVDHALDEDPIFATSLSRMPFGETMMEVGKRLAGGGL